MYHFLLFVLKAVRSTVSRLEELVGIHGSVMGGIHASGSVGQEVQENEQDEEGGESASRTFLARRRHLFSCVGGWGRTKETLGDIFL